MKNIRPCPYCGGEVEMVKLIKRRNEKIHPYRIQCMKCRALVARGIGYPDESEEAAKERIKEYTYEIEKLYSPTNSTKIKQSISAKERDWEAENSDLFGPDDELNEIHDITHRIIKHKDLT